MENTELVDTVKTFVTKNISVKTLMESLPHDTEVKVCISERYTGYLSFKDNAVHYSDTSLGSPEFELHIDTEAVRRISQSNPSSLAQLLEELGRQTLAGEIQWKIKATPKELWDRGHILTAKRLYPHIQAELMQKLLMALGAANMFVETAKSKIKDVWK